MEARLLSVSEPAIALLVGSAAPPCNIYNAKRRLENT
jgi:hypothetical protein